MRNPRLKHLLAAIALIGAGLAGCHKSKPPPSIDGLADALERSAEKALPPPSLASEQIILPVQPGQAGLQASAVLGAASAAGGVAIRSVTAQGEVSILATIPENNAEAFKAALRHEKTPMASPSPHTTLIEILIKNSAASPAP